ncbi:hypothetical protein [Rickettsiales endosymbiont of Stachyamoeba lipophora]|uniref:hypothetical protein n=1 Tax=Rickettsiales endosymbiont of Stachyamoeba lipophora TaxID=2486578 RepID=UPI000F647F0D|nr:hypothetical protein [Rickettsiales endosymbiont of Stachyamoeba lipophora]AZL16041.1 hypothetical protein EF513_05765 [Rickettsiales endosymbiont of Stachyamoeba lipophora]
MSTISSLYSAAASSIPLNELESLLLKLYLMPPAYLGKPSYWNINENACYLYLQTFLYDTKAPQTSLNKKQEKINNLATACASWLQKLSLPGKVLIQPLPVDELTHNIDYQIFISLEREKYDSLLAPIIGTKFSAEEALAQLQLKLSQAQTQSRASWTTQVGIPSSSQSSAVSNTQNNNTKSIMHKI